MKQKLWFRVIGTEYDGSAKPTLEEAWASWEFFVLQDCKSEAYLSEARKINYARVIIGTTLKAANAGTFEKPEGKIGTGYWKTYLGPTLVSKRKAYDPAISG